jgi:protein involved in polysaccharide export with SLBB domain
VGEWLVLTIPELPAPGRDWVRAVQVDPNGDIPVPYIGPAHVAGLTLGPAERAVADTWWGRVTAFSRIYPSLRRVDTRPTPLPGC